MKTEEKTVNLVTNLKRWQRIEDATLSLTSKIIEETENPLIRQVMEIIQYDSHMHYRVQQFIINSLEKEQMNLPVEDLEKVWELIEKHNEAERKSVDLAEACLDDLKGTKNVIQQYLLSYLMDDEKKHDKILDSLNLIKKGMYP